MGWVGGWVGVRVGSEPATGAAALWTTPSSSFSCMVGPAAKGASTVHLRSSSDRAMQLMTAGWKLWPAVGLITYTIVPLRHRLLWVDAIEIVYRSAVSVAARCSMLPPSSSCFLLIPASCPVRCPQRHSQRLEQQSGQPHRRRFRSGQGGVISGGQRVSKGP